MNFEMDDFDHKKMQMLFLDIRRKYFSRWDSKFEWKICYGSFEQLRGNTGYCDSKEKKIFIDKKMFSTMSHEGKQMFIIHEICHEVGSAFHGKGWIKRMEKAAIKAENLNEIKLAILIRDEIFSYSS